MKINWRPERGDLVSVPDRMIGSQRRIYAIVTDVSKKGNLLEVLMLSEFVYIHRDEVLPIIDLEGRWIQLGR